MKFISGYCTDAGAIKRINQDALCLKSAEYNSETVILAAVCDGLGGLSDGEAASSYVISKLSEWFERKLPDHLSTGSTILKIRQDIDEMLHDAADSLNLYSEITGKQLGTTMTCLLYIEKYKKIMAVHIGDTRIYRITDKTNDILTIDHSVIYDEILNGTLAEKDAARDSRQSQLTKCIGAGLKNISFDYSINDAVTDTVYLICSDGFRKTVSREEIASSLSPAVICDDITADKKLRELTDKCIIRNETDNISSLIIILNSK